MCSIVSMSLVLPECSRNSAIRHVSLRYTVEQEIIIHVPRVLSCDLSKVVKALLLFCFRFIPMDLMERANMCC